MNDDGKTYVADINVQKARCRKMPVIFNEPLSFLQRLVEYMEYIELLEKASEETDPVSRMQVGFTRLLIVF